MIMFLTLLFCDSSTLFFVNIFFCFLFEILKEILKAYVLHNTISMNEVFHLTFPPHVFSVPLKSGAFYINRVNGGDFRIK